MNALLERTVIEFTVYGTPRPQGSMRAFRHKTTGAVINVPDNKLTKPWKQEIAGMASMETPGMIPFAKGVPVSVAMNFYFAKPKSVKREAMTVKPDGDKLVRAIFDAIKGILIHDDAQVVQFFASKYYGTPERVEIKIQEA